MNIDFVQLTVVGFKCSNFVNQHGADLLNDLLKGVQLSVADEPIAFHLHKDLQHSLKFSTKKKIQNLP